MKKVFKFYSAIWTVLLGLFNVITFLSVESLEILQYVPSFWIGYVFITLSFIGQIVCAYFALEGDDIKKTFYNASLITTSYTGLITSFVFGGLCMIISSIPYWVGIILCAIVLVFNIIALIKASVAVDIVSGIDDKVKAKVLFIKSLTVDAENLIACAKSERSKTECKKIYEAFQYSDPISNEILASVETEIAIKFSNLSDAVVTDDLEAVCSLANELMILIDKRNKKCKVLK